MPESRLQLLCGPVGKRRGGRGFGNSQRYKVMMVHVAVHVSKFASMSKMQAAMVVVDTHWSCDDWVMGLSRSWTLKIRARPDHTVSGSGVAYMYAEMRSDGIMQ